MNYKDCKILCNLTRSNNPLVSEVTLDEATSMVDKYFDYDFTGVSKFYPFEIPDEIYNIEFKTLAIVGASGSGKSSMLKRLTGYKIENILFDNTKAIVSCFNNPDDATKKLCAVGLNSIPTWCRPRNVLSIGEGFRADLALNLESYRVFDEFTSTIDRNVAKSTCKGVKRYIEDNGLHHIIFSSCHKDFIPYLSPDIVIDLDDECAYDCRGVDLKKALLSKCIELETQAFGEFLGTITI